MNIIIANSVGKIRDNLYICPFPSRWTSVFKDYPIFTFYPYELGYLSSLLKRELKDAHIELVDGAYLRFTPDEYIRYLKLKKPEWLIFEVDTVTYSANLKVARALKEELGVKIIMTGQYPTAFPEKCLEDGADFACLGEYEYTVLDILMRKNPREIKGLHPNGMRPLQDINSLPFPEDSDIKRIDYSYSGGCRWTKYREIEIHASRGCPYRCVFCVAGTVYYEKPNWRIRKTDNIIQEILYLKNKYPEMEGLFFNEETHIISKKATLKLCESIIKAGLNNLHYEAMANYMNLDPEIIKALAQAGYYKLRIGIETLDEETGNRIGVKVDEEKLTRVLKAARDCDIEIYSSFLLGAPGSTRKKDEKTISAGRRLIEKGLIQSFQASIAVPHAGTPFYKMAEKEGWFNTKDPESFNGINGSVVDYPNYKSSEIAEMMKKLHTEFSDAGKNYKNNNRSRSSHGNKIAMTSKEKNGALKMIEEIDNSCHQENNGRGLRLSQDIVKQFPRFITGQLKLGELYLKKGNISEAKSSFEKVLELAQDYDDARRHASKAHFSLGLIDLLNENQSSGLDHITKSIHLDSETEKVKKYFWKVIEGIPLSPNEITCDFKTL